MQSAAITKIERVTEAVESMIVSVNAMQNAEAAADRTRLFEVVQDSRKELRESLAEFIKPLLRLAA